MGQNGNICVIMMDMREDYRDDYVVGIERQANNSWFRSRRLTSNGSRYKFNNR